TVAMKTPSFLFLAFVLLIAHVAASRLQGSTFTSIQTLTQFHDSSRQFILDGRQLAIPLPAHVLPPLAIVGGLVQGIGNSLRRLQEGTIDLWGNTKQLGGLKKRFARGETLTFPEYNLMQKTSGDIAKFVGLALFTMSKPEFTPFLCSFFPAVVPSTYLNSDEKLQRCQQRNFARVRGVVTHLMSLQQEAVAPHRKENDRMRHLRTMERLLHTTTKAGPGKALKQVGDLEYVLFCRPKRDGKGRQKADLRAVPRPFLVSVCNAIGMFHKFIPAAGLRTMLSDYLWKIDESDQVLLNTNVDKLGRDDLLDACAQRALSLGDASPDAMRANLKSYLKCVSRPSLAPPVVRKKESEQEGKVVALNENNMRFALLGLNMVGLVRDAKENSALRALFGCT
ncbi:hypothetical protein NGA_2009600, partial [Nannochloropsis gaditana CCMP526]